MSKFSGNVRVEEKVKKKAFSSIVAVFLVLVMSFSLASCNINTGENVFSLTIDEYLERYNSKLGGDISVDDFEKDTEEEDIFYYLNMGVGSFIVTTDVQEPNYINGISFSYTSEKQGDIVMGVYYLVEALYPEDNPEEISKAFDIAFNEGSTTYKAVEISVYKSNNFQSWKVYPKRATE